MTVLRMSGKESFVTHQCIFYQCFSFTSWAFVWTSTIFLSAAPPPIFRFFTFWNRNKCGLYTSRTFDQTEWVLKRTDVMTACQCTYPPQEGLSHSLCFLSHSRHRCKPLHFPPHSDLFQSEVFLQQQKFSIKVFKKCPDFTNGCLHLNVNLPLRCVCLFLNHASLSLGLMKWDHYDAKRSMVPYQCRSLSIWPSWSAFCLWSIQSNLHCHQRLHHLS